MNDSIEDQILSQERRAIESLACETHTAIAKVQETFLIEYEKLAVNARVKSYLPLLTRKNVRAILDARNARSASPAAIAVR